MVLGWSTLAPKYASSAASAYDKRGIVRAAGTTRGSAVSTPDTSVQIWISRAPTAAPTNAAVYPSRSRPSVVVVTPLAVAAMKPPSTWDPALREQRASLRPRPPLGLGGIWRCSAPVSRRSRGAAAGVHDARGETAGA